MIFYEDINILVKFLAKTRSSFIYFPLIISVDFGIQVLLLTFFYKFKQDFCFRREEFQTFLCIVIQFEVTLHIEILSKINIFFKINDEL